MRGLASLLLLVLIEASSAFDDIVFTDETDPENYYKLALQLRTTNLAESMRLIQLSADGGFAEAQAVVGLAHAQGQGGLEQSSELAAKWWRLAAAQGHADATYNLVAMCGARPSCLEATSAEQAVNWLRSAADQGHAAAAYEAAIMLSSRFPGESLLLYKQAAKSGHAAAMYNLGSHLYQEKGEVTRAILWFARAGNQTDDEKVRADAEVASKALRRLWVQRAEASDVDESTQLFEAAREGEDADSDDGELLSFWSKGMSSWKDFQHHFHHHASFENTHAIEKLRDAMMQFESALRQLGAGRVEPEHMTNKTATMELRRYLLLSKLSEGAKTLMRDDLELLGSAYWLESIAYEPLCQELYATNETQPSCFNDQLASAITTLRRHAKTKELPDGQIHFWGDDGAGKRVDALVKLGNEHPHAATKWTTAAQTPRVFVPWLTPQMGWWDASKFALSEKLEKAWEMGELHEDLKRIDAAVAQAAKGVDKTATFERIVSSGAPIRAPSGTDGDKAGVWSEFMLFDGTEWNEPRCAAAQALCKYLRSSPEVAGEVVHADGTVTPPQGQVTIFKLKPGAHVLPHVGVTNRRLVLQFPLRGWKNVTFRVDEEWRPYNKGKAMVFDDSFEHEVVHNGKADRVVLYAVLHHPGLGTPRLRGGGLKDEV